MRVLTSSIFRRSALGAAVLSAAVGAQATIVNFDAQGLSGPPYADETVAGPVTVSTSDGPVTFSNGAVLTNESALPADETSVYYNSFFLPGTSGSSMTVTFAAPINNFFLNLYNGQSYSDTFTVSDNMGQSTTVSIAPDSASGVSLISFPAVGSVVTITTADSSYDYSIDNIGFNQATPTPEPETWALMGLGLGAIGFMARRRKAAKTQGH